jgi:hypothetical protein
VQSVKKQKTLARSYTDPYFKTLFINSLSGDAAVLKFVAPDRAWGFESPSGHHETVRRA